MPFQRKDGSYDTSGQTRMIVWWNASPKDWPYLSSFSNVDPSPAVQGSPLLRLGEGGGDTCSFSVSFTVPDVPPGTYPIVVLQERRRRLLDRGITNLPSELTRSRRPEATSLVLSALMALERSTGETALRATGG